MAFGSAISSWMGLTKIRLLEMSNLAKQVVQIAGLGAGGYALGQSILWVPEGRRGMVVNTMTGESRGPLEEGVHLRVPFRDVASAIDMRASEREVEVLAPCKDGLKLSVTLRCSVRVAEEALGDMVGLSAANLVERVVPAIGTDAVRHGCGFFFVDQIVGEASGPTRVQMFAKVEERLAQRAAEFHLELVPKSTHFPHIGIPLETQRQMSKLNEGEVDDMLALAALQAQADTPTEAQKEDAIDQQIIQALMAKEGERLAAAKQKQKQAAAAPPAPGVVKFEEGR